MSTVSHEKTDLESGRLSNDRGITANNGIGAPLNGEGAAMMPAWGGAFQPGPYKPSFRKFANPAPLGLCAFALTTFILSLINANTRGVKIPSIVVGSAFAYGGLVQLLAGMWEMAVGNTFGATALSSYGGFWISWALIETEGLGYTAEYSKPEFQNAIGYFLIAWFIFTFLCLLCTFKSTLAFFSLFFFLDITFLLLAIGHLQADPVTGAPLANATKAGGVFGLITAFIAWWNALAGMLENSNSFFTVPVVHFPWSEKVKAEKAKARAE